MCHQGAKNVMRPTMKKFISLILTIISMVVFSVSAFADDPMVTRGQAEHCVGTDGRVGQIICTSSRTYASGTQKTGCQHGRVGYVDVRTQYEKVENYACTVCDYSEENVTVSTWWGPWACQKA